MEPIAALVGVYDADGGLRGELAYLAGKARGQHCSLCDITHSPIRRRRAWDDYCATLPVPFEVLHRNERSSAVEAATAGIEPCVVAIREDDRIVVLLRDDELRQAQDVAGLAEAIDSALARLGLSWPERATPRFA